MVQCRYLVFGGSRFIELFPPNQNWIGFEYSNLMIGNK